MKSRTIGTSKLIYSVYGFKSSIIFLVFLDFTQIMKSSVKISDVQIRSMLTLTDWLCSVTIKLRPTSYNALFAEALGRLPCFTPKFQYFTWKKSSLLNNIMWKSRKKLKKICVGIVVKTFSRLLWRFSMIPQSLTLKSVITTAI